MNPTRFLSRALLFLCLVLSFPFLVAFAGENNLSGSTSQLSPEAPKPQPPQDPEGSDRVDFEENPSESTLGNKTDCILITHICARDVTIRLRRIPVGFYVAVKTENGIQRTSNEPASIGKDVVEWNDEIILPSDLSSRISFTVFAPFELGPTLGDGEALREFETTVGELLGSHGPSELIKFVEQSDEEVNPSLSYFEIKIERRIYGLNGYTTASNPPESEEMLRLAELTDRGYRALIRYREHREQRDLDESIKYFEDAQDLCPQHNLSRATVLFNLATAKLIYCRMNGAFTGLEVPISLYRDVIRLRPRGHPDHPLTLLSLGIALEARFQRQHDEADGTEGKTLLSQLLDVVPTDSYPYHAAVLALGSTARPELIKATESDLDDDRKVHRLDAALQHMSHPESWKHVLLDHLGILLCIRFHCLGDLGDPARAVSMLEAVVQFTSNDHPVKPLWLDSLGGLLSTRYERFGDIVDLEKSIALHQDAVQFTPDGHPDKCVRLNNLGYSLWARYERFGDVIDLERSFSVYEDAVQSTPDNHPNKPTMLNNLGSLFSTRYERFGAIIDLERSISLGENAIQYNGHPDKPLWLNNLGGLLSARYERFGDVTDLERSIALREDVVQFTPDGHPDKPLRLNDLGYSLQVRYERFGDVADLERSFSLYEDAVQFTPDDHPKKPTMLNNLGSLFSTRYKHFGAVTDLERSILLKENAIQLTADGHPAKPSRLNNLGDSLFIRYMHFRDATDLERSISLSQDTVQFTPDGHPDKPMWLNNLSSLFLTRYERFGDLADLKRSISLGEDAVQFTPDGHPDKPFQLNTLGYSLSTRYERFGDVADLERSISLYADAVQFIPDGHPNKPATLNCLGSLFSTRYERFSDIVDLERSILLGEDSVQFTPDGHPDKPLRLHNLAISLLRRFLRSGDLSSSDLSQANLCFSRAACSSTGPSLDRLRASQRWVECVRLLRRDSQFLLDAYTVTIDLLPQLAWIGLSLHDRYHLFLQVEHGTCDAAAAALGAHKAALAIEWLEQSRSIVWSQFSQLRTPVDDLRPVYPELAAQFERVSRELEHASIRDVIAVANEFAPHSNMNGGVLEKEVRQHHALALSRERLLLEICALPGLERFLLPKTIKQLSSLAHAGPVVFLNASRYRCDALIVIAGSKDVIHVPLSNTSYDEVAGMQLRLSELLRLNSKGRVLRDDSDRGARIRDMTPDDVFRSILTHLWEKVVSPILEVLALSKSGPNLPRIFWCPTGPFSFLPIHAAGLYGTTIPGPKLSDFAISSYIPTMSALELPREDSQVTPRSICLLAVPQPSTDGQVHLTGVRDEIGIIRKLASSSPFVSFQEADGTVEDVLSKMKETDWVHFACHGMQDRTDPYDSGLLLADGRRLKLADIARVSRPHGGLAFLSACHTATGDEKLSEEAIHIAAGMLLAGYRGVIATMWSIMDNDAPRIAEDVYKNLFRDDKVPDSRQAAEALYHAIEQLRDSGASFLSWVPFIHVGL